MTEQVVTNALAFHRANRDPSNFAAKVRSRAWWGFQFETSVSLCNLTPAAVLLPLLRDACRRLELADAVSPVLAAVVNTTVVADENLTVGSTVWLPAEGLSPGR